jgi:hypothetical protein
LWINLIFENLDVTHFTSVFYLQFFTTEPYACEPSSLPKYPPSKELDVKMRDEEARRSSYFFFLLVFNFLIDSSFSDVLHFILRQKALNGKSNGVDGTKRARARERSRAIPAPEANAENQTNLDVSQTCSYVCLLYLTLNFYFSMPHMLHNLAAVNFNCCSFNQSSKHVTLFHDE